MADDLRRGFMTPEEPAQSAPQGGLASKAFGGLAKFLDNVNRGVEIVTSNPLYQRAWSGFVSGAVGDPMAGPFALQQIQQNELSQQFQQKQLESMQESPAQRSIRESEERAKLYQAHLDEKLRNTPITDPSYRETWAARYPAQYGQQAFGPQAQPKPVQVLRDGKPVYVSPADAIGMEPVPRSPLVNVYDGMKPDQIIQAEDRAAGRVDEKAKPLEVALDAYRSFRALADKIAARGTPPSSAETDSLAKLAARLENPEAVQEGDIARKAGGSFANFFAGKAGLPYTLDMDQLSGLVSTADTIAAAKKSRLDEIYAGAQGVAAGRGFNPGAVAPGAQGVGVVPQPPSDAPPGSKLIDARLGIWEAPNGDWYR